MSGEGTTPWVGGDLKLPNGALAAIEAHALECYPNESCGFVAGPAAQPALCDEPIRQVNEADKYHALDPDRFPRTARTYFKMNELRAARAFEEGEANGRPIKIIYHSHCDAGAYFSAEDSATFAGDQDIRDDLTCLFRGHQHQAKVLAQFGHVVIRQELVQGVATIGREALVKTFPEALGFDTGVGARERAGHLWVPGRCG